MYNLPTIKKDELLHSYLYRIHDMGHHYTLVGTLKDILKSSKLGGHIYVPENGEVVYHTLLNEEYDSVEEMLTNHSLFNFYVAFQGEKGKKKLLEKVVKGKKGAYKIIKYNEVRISSNLRFCPECLKEQKEKDGDFAWNRLHQIVPICTKHNAWIQESTMPTTMRVFEYNQYAKVYPVTVKAIKEDNFEVALDISRRIEDILNNPIYVTNSRLRDIYRVELDKRGLLCATGVSVKKTQLKSQFKTYIGESLLRQLGIGTEHMQCVDHMLDQYQYTVHPLYHVLMQSFLNINLHNLSYYREVTDIKPKVTCYCMNPLSEHYKKHIIDDIKVHYCSITKKHMCTFFCSCGYVYTTKLDEVNNSNGTKVSKIKAYGEEYERRLIELRHLGIKGIARLTGINHGTIRRQIRHYDTYGEIERKWIESQAESKQEKELRGSDENKKNRWLVAKWQEKDQAYFDTVWAIIQNELDDNNKPKRITRTRLAKLVGAVHAIVYCIDKIPKTKALIEQYQETSHEFRMRRIEWAIRQCIKDGVELVPWKVLSISGLQDKTSDAICQVTETLIEVATTKIEAKGR